jgi:asparagine synthase (glutamine-hydrolysing)
MCAIAAIYNYHYAAPEINGQELCAIRDHMSARGPDGKGTWFSKKGEIGLAHQRLSIIDINERAAQPMSTTDGQCVISFNGEIYNYKALRQQLEYQGIQFRTQSDTEVLLHLYRQKGVAMLSELRGMFAFALWDAKKNKLLLARDPYGIKPLYYADDGWTVRVASQVKALLAGGKISSSIEPAGITGFLLFGSVPEPYTIYQQIRAVPAGSFIWVDEIGAHTPVHYFSLAKVFCQAIENPQPFNQEAASEALLDSVSQHLVADVPVGAFLSSGVDSGALVALMKDAGQKDIQTVTLAFEEFQQQHRNEAPLAAEIAKRYATQHTTRIVTEAEFVAELPKILAAMDQPSIDGINTWFVSKAAKELGLKVAISGLGGDELFGGYPAFVDIPRWVKQLSIPAKIPFIGTVIQKLSTTFITPYSSLSPKMAGMLKYGGNYSGAYLLKRGLFMPWEISQLINKEMAEEGLRSLVPLKHIKANISPEPQQAFSRIATLEAGLYMRNQLLRDTDWASMAHSLEIRAPLVDSVLLSKLAPMLVTQTPLDGKTILGKSPSLPLPDMVTKRAKTGFETPVATWQQDMDSLQAWKNVPLLKRKNCHWARRWAYDIIQPVLS